MQHLKTWALSVVMDDGYTIALGPFDDNAAKYILVRGNETVYLADVDKLIEFASKLEAIPVAMSA